VNAQTGALQNKEAWLASITNRTLSFDLVESSELKARANNDLGLVTGVVHLKGRDAQAQPLDYSLRFTMTFVSWRVVGTEMGGCAFGKKVIYIRRSTENRLSQNRGITKTNSDERLGPIGRQLRGLVLEFFAQFHWDWR